LGGDARNHRECQSDCGEAETECEGAACLQPDSNEPGNQQQSQYQPGSGSHHQCRGQRGVPPDHSRAKQLSPPRLFLLPGVADHGEDGH
jgi:hypothetical protein